MKKPKMHLYVLATMLAGCSPGGGDDPSPTPPSTPSTNGRIEVAIATTMQEAEGWTFAQGDQGGLYMAYATGGNAEAPEASGNYIDNLPFTYGTGWTTATKAYWKDSTSRANLFFYSPYNPSAANAKAIVFSVNADQSTEAAHRASDLLTGSALNIAPTPNAVAIAMRRAMSVIKIRLEAGNGFAASDLANATVSINGTMTNATIDLASATITPTGQPTPITPLKTADGYEAFVVPQSVDESDIITITVNGDDYNLSRAMSLAAGKTYECTVTISKAGSSLNTTITKWDDDGTDYGGTAQ